MHECQMKVDYGSSSRGYIFIPHCFKILRTYKVILKAVCMKNFLNVYFY